MADPPLKRHDIVILSEDGLQPSKGEDLATSS